MRQEKIQYNIKGMYKVHRVINVTREVVLYQNVSVRSRVQPFVSCSPKGVGLASSGRGVSVCPGYLYEKKSRREGARAGLGCRLGRDGASRP